MRLKNILCFFTAAVMSVCMAVPVFAEEEEEEEVADYWANEEMLTSDTAAPALSFDLTDWTNTVHLTKDASLISLELKQETTYAYQGSSLKINAATSKDITAMCNNAWAVRDENNNLVYPDSENEDAEFITPGVELHANEFGMNYFDGCMITFEYRINPDVKGLLMDDSVYVFPSDDVYESLSSTSLQLQYNDSDSNNTTQYAKAVVSVAEKVGATKLIIEVPLIHQTDATDIIYIDNINVVTPLQDGDGNDLRVANIDGYNENAQPQEIVQGLQVKEKENTLSYSDDSDAEKKAVKNNVILYVGIVILVAAVVVVVIIFIKKHRNKFY